MKDEPELSGPVPEDPETERPKPATGKYIPPHLRNKQQSKYVPPHLRQGGAKTYVPPHMRKTTGPRNAETFPHTTAGGADSPLNFTDLTPTTPTRTGSPEIMRCKMPDNLDVVGPSVSEFVRGGCADPLLIQGSVMDRMYIPKKVSRVGKSQAVAFGCYGGGRLDNSTSSPPNKATKKSSLRWEMGAVSECGIRDSNEDAFLIANDVLHAFQSSSFGAVPDNSWTKDHATHNPGLFAIFDGHCGNQAARFAVETLGRFIHDELLATADTGNAEIPFSPSSIESILRDAMIRMDDDFCKLCQEDGREWESGATALVAMIANENLVVANLGDCRGVLCRLVDDVESYEGDEDWCRLENLYDDMHVPSKDEANRCFWKEVTNTHSPAAEEERARIEQANGWITTETEIPIGQLRRMDFLDEDVIGILERCLHYPSGNAMGSLTDSDRSTKECKAVPQRIIHISRVCGELAVSRALGDRDFKASFNSSPSTVNDDYNNGGGISPWWDCPLLLPYPDDHSRQFQGDLVSNTPDFQRLTLGGPGVSDEFLLLACDGLWDVMDTDDAVRVVRDLLFRKRWTAKKAAARLAELAIHLGSSDNVTVILIRLFSKGSGDEGCNEVLANTTG
jgi:serine/threonine protein phosphatase PrpC